MQIYCSLIENIYWVKDHIVRELKKKKINKCINMKNYNIKKLV